jgi:hypothetical protein
MAMLPVEMISFQVLSVIGNEEEDSLETGL